MNATTTVGAESIQILPSQLMANAAIKPRAETACRLCRGGAVKGRQRRAIVGEAKSKKTFLTTALVASAIAYRVKATQAFKNISNNITLNVLWLDTANS